MSGLFSPKATTSNIEMIDSFKVTSSAYGLCIPIVYGQTRIGSNLIYYNDFTPINHGAPQSGKGGGGSAGGNNYTYTARVILALCEGPISGVQSVWRDKSYFNPAIGTGPFTLLYGTATQSPWGSLQAAHPEHAIGYSGTACTCHDAMDLGSGANMQNHSWEVIGLYADTQWKDADPSYILQDFLTNPRYGCGFPSGKLDPTAYAQFTSYVRASDCFISPAYTEAKPAADHIEELLRICNCGAVWSGDTLKIVPYADTAVSSARGMGTYYPNVTPIFDLTFEDFIADTNEDPVKIRRKSPADAYNNVQLEFQNRSNEYNSEVVEAQDLGNIEQYGLRVADPVRMHAICDPTLARQVAQRLLQRELYVRNEYEFTLGIRYMMLEPMDLVTLTDSTLGLNKKAVRIKSVEEDEDCLIRVTAEEWPFGVATATKYPTQWGNGGGSGADTQVSPGNVQLAMIFEPPGDLTDGLMEVWVSATGGENWGGCEIWASRDNATYSYVGTVEQPCKIGYATDYAYGFTWDQMQLLLVGSNNTISSISSADAAHYQTLSVIQYGSQTEFFSYLNAQLTGASGTNRNYRISTITHGLFNGSRSLYSYGSLFTRLDGSPARIDAKRWNKDETIYLKFLSFNKYGQAKQTLDQVSSRAYTIQGTALAWPPPAAVTLTVNDSKPVFGPI